MSGENAQSNLVTMSPVTRVRRDPARAPPPLPWEHPWLQAGNRAQCTEWWRTCLTPGHTPSVS